MTTKDVVRDRQQTRRSGRRRPQHMAQRAQTRPLTQSLCTCLGCLPRSALSCPHLLWHRLHDYHDCELSRIRANCSTRNTLQRLCLFCLNTVGQRTFAVPEEPSHFPYLPEMTVSRYTPHQMCVQRRHLAGITFLPTGSTGGPFVRAAARRARQLRAIVCTSTNHVSI